MILSSYFLMLVFLDFSGTEESVVSDASSPVLSTSFPQVKTTSITKVKTILLPTVEKPAVSHDIRTFGNICPWRVKLRQGSCILYDTKLVWTAQKWSFFSFLKKLKKTFSLVVITEKITKMIKVYYRGALLSASLIAKAITILVSLEESNRRSLFVNY